jgi:hypothetical protein
MTHTAKVRASLAEIPRKKWRLKLQRLAIAVGLAALLYFVAIPQKWPLAVILGIAGAIGYCISADFTRAIIRFLVAAIRDVLAAIKNGKSDPGAPA